MERRTAKVASISRGTSESANRAKPVVTGRRPSRSRSTEAMTGTCKVCGGNSWDADDIRGETICADCGYVAAENMIDPGAEWVNHSGGDDRSRVGAPTTLTLSDKGLSTEIRRSDLTSGGARRHG
ncbi:MAG: TFIIB-type zinc ribbon-containing protein, partial [Candidatus Thalassarchaeaceae archaeon]|nr:TFIIB-type zinc ribbon-containing protein [Candidatus Thalassarchaeaceae archaeon]HJL55313.1 TFIIB-type zinc ribbon-containing protein [Candidatus Thalassarchaeaceae archaeon]